MRVFEFLVIFSQQVLCLLELAKWRCCLNVWHFLIFQDTVLSLAISVFMGTCWWPLADTAGQWHTNNLGISWHKHLFSFPIPSQKIGIPRRRQKYDTPIFNYILTQTVFIFSICVLHNWIYLAPPLCCGFLNKFICGN